MKNRGEIDGYNEEGQARFSISNFINTLRNENLILQGQNDLFMNYLSFFLDSQQKQYERIYKRIVIFSCEVESTNGARVQDDIAMVEEETSSISASNDVPSRKYVPLFSLQVPPDEPISPMESENVINDSDREPTKVEAPQLEMSFE
jgi:hypothetical protein